MNDKDYVKVSKSEFFDRDWYLDEYKDVALIGMDPIEHYIKYGYLLKRDPSERFSTKLYLEAHKDVDKAKLNPLLHYLNNGRREGRKYFTRDGEQRISNEYSRKSSLISPAISDVNVLYHSHNLKWQGAPNSLFEIAKGINSSKGFSSQLISSSEGPLTAVYQSSNIPCHLFPFPSRGIPEDESKYNGYINRLSEYYKGLGINIIHANTLQCYFSVLAAKKANIPVVWNVRESEDPKSYFDYLPEYLRNRAFNAISEADKVVFVAQATMNLWRESVAGNNFELITNGVDTKRLHIGAYGQQRSLTKIKFNIPQSNTVVLSVGTVSERKNQRELLNGYKIALERGLKNVSLLIVGMNTTDYSDEIRSFAFELESIGGHVVLVEETSSHESLSIIAEAYSAADIFCINSLVESYPRVVVEAFSFGLPVIASKCFGTVEQLTQGENGFLYDQGDVEALSQHIIQLAEDRELRKTMSKAAFRRTDELNTYNTMVSRYKNIYKELVENY